MSHQVLQCTAQFANMLTLCDMNMTFVITDNSFSPWQQQSSQYNFGIHVLPRVPKKHRYSATFQSAKGPSIYDVHMEGGGGQAQMDACGQGEGVQPHVDVHTSYCLLLMQRSWRLFLPEFVINLMVVLIAFTSLG